MAAVTPHAHILWKGLVIAGSRVILLALVIQTETAALFRHSHAQRKKETGT